jgi:hypothetical protein
MFLPENSVTAGFIQNLPPWQSQLPNHLHLNTTVIAADSEGNMQ